MSQLKEDQLISQPAPCSSNSWAVMGRENVIAEPPTPPCRCFIACILVTEVTDIYIQLTSYNMYNCTLNLHILQCLACDGCRHYVTDVRHFPTDGWTPPTRQISQKRFHKSERKLHDSVICHIYRKLIFGHT